MIKYPFPSADRAAPTPLMLATQHALGEASGGYYRSQRHRKNPLDFDAALSERLWEVASAATGIGL